MAVGPEWLAEPVAFWPHKNVSIMRTNLEEKKTASVNAMQVRNCLKKFQRISSTIQLIRTWAFVNRALQPMKRSKRAQCGTLTATEIQAAHFEILRDVQEESSDQINSRHCFKRSSSKIKPIEKPHAVCG